MEAAHGDGRVVVFLSIIVIIFFLCINIFDNSFRRYICQDKISVIKTRLYELAEWERQGIMTKNDKWEKKHIIKELDEKQKRLKQLEYEMNRK